MKQDEGERKVEDGKSANIGIRYPLVVVELISCDLLHTKWVVLGNIENDINLSRGPISFLNGPSFEMSGKKYLE